MADHDPIEDINKKLDILMEHVGCKMSKEKYMHMSDDEKDEFDEKDLKEKKEEKPEE